VLADTVGFLQRLPTQLVAAFRGTLEEVVHADMLLHVIDASHPDWPAQAKVVHEVLRTIGAGDHPVVTVFNKADQLGPDEVRQLMAEHPEDVVISAMRGDGLRDLLGVIVRRLPEPWMRLRLKIPYTEGKLLARIHAEGRVLSQRFEGDGVFLDAEVPGTLAVLLRALKTRARSRLK